MKSANILRQQCNKEAMENASEKSMFKEEHVWAYQKHLPMETYNEIKLK